ncbi:unnamed protein product [Gongylonema pulchrum]|uniref:Ovule protein n=1 Tax=Gongylonema pulchrum TaxID=637853 RepID=A0A183CUV7_9BILA|nr:unnamed protein product [Gongylonema pulchrum]
MIAVAPIPADHSAAFAFDLSIHSLYFFDKDQVFLLFPCLLSLNYSLFKVLPRRNFPLIFFKNCSNAVNRQHNDGSIHRFLNSVSVKFMTVIPRFAILIIASDYLIVSYRLTSTFDQECEFVRVYFPVCLKYILSF